MTPQDLSFEFYNSLIAYIIYIYIEACRLKLKFNRPEIMLFESHLSIRMTI